MKTDMNTSQLPESEKETPKSGTEVPSQGSTENPIESPTESPIESPTESPTDSPTESPTKVPCSVQILQVLSRVPEMRTRDIHAAVTTKTKSWIAKAIKDLYDAGKILKVRHGWYALNMEMMTRTESQNVWTVNMLLNLYDREMARLLSTPNIDYGELESIMNALYRCSMVVERTLKRWYLVDRGYDTNTRQAVEDAKKKTVEREKQETENAPPEDQVVIVREYDESMRRALANLPGKELKKRTV